MLEGVTVNLPTAGTGRGQTLTRPRDLKSKKLQTGK